ncbi:RseA family anti-sigma factor [Duganella qianjiadongensis]|nr:RseA family anti-sigma factor [Duganella qianjiadongensis]
MHEQLSALADGELDESERELALAALATPDGQQYWRACHLIRVALQADAGAAATAIDGGAFQSRLARRLAAEPAYGRRTAAAGGEAADAGGTDAPSSATLP